MSDRSCSGTFMWNGKDLATHYNPGDYEAEDRLWATEQKIAVLFKAERIPLSDHVLLHEMGHWLAAPSYLRDLPEWGLDIVLGSEVFCANGGYHLNPEEKYLRGVVDAKEASTQEYIAYLLEHTWCAHYRVAFNYLGWLEHYSPDFKGYWDTGLWRDNRGYVIPQVRELLTKAENKTLDWLLNGPTVGR